ncbi:uncharacterized protein LOC141854674 [Brevipalpus obovatus]|uniref:uncharacterized protein LOC141854674 n=1 Tax=Brevipalpus obovatus TaxID=246614 RepID=UPI003D9F15E9
MELYDWNEFSKSPLKLVVDHSIREQLYNLLSLSRDHCLLTEIAIFRKNLAKISTRLRNSKISTLLMKINRSIQAYITMNIPLILESQCSDLLNEKYVLTECSVRLPKGENIVRVMDELRKLADILDSICRYSSYSVSHCMLWLRLGHMIPHFIVCLSTLSRLNIISRALLVYIADLYNGLKQFCHLCKDNNKIDKPKLSVEGGSLEELCAKPIDQKSGFVIPTRTKFDDDIEQLVERESEKFRNQLKNSMNVEKVHPTKKNENSRITKSKHDLQRCKALAKACKKFSAISVMRTLKRKKRLHAPCNSVPRSDNDSMESTT